MSFRTMAVCAAMCVAAGCSEGAEVRDASVTDVVAVDAPSADVAAADGSTAAPVEIRFAAVVGAMPFACTSGYTGIGSANSAWTPLDFRFYVHDVRLVPATGEPVAVTLTDDGTWQHRDVALLDFEDASGTCANGTAATNDRVRGTVTAPAGTRWTGVRFRLGVPQDLNQRNAATAPSPLNLSTLFWSWQSGYKFVRLDGRSGSNAVNIHVGSTGCTGSPSAGTVTCSEPNRPEYVLTGFDPAQNVVVADLGALVATTDVSRDRGAAPGCMSDLTDPECGTIFPALGIPLGASSATQTFFRVR